MKQILRDGEPFTWGDSLRQVADFTGEEITRYSFALEDLKAELVELCNAGYEAAVAALTSAYPPSEIATWEVQRQEAARWAADPGASTPWIDTAAAVRGVPREIYLQRTLAKAAQFAAASAYLTGRRQAIDDAIKVAASAQALAAILIDYTLPGVQ